MITINGEEYEEDELPEEARPLLKKFSAACELRDQRMRESEMLNDLVNAYADTIAELVE